MISMMMRAGVAMLVAASLTGNAWAGCISPADMAALKTAAMQQELMVAAFSCHDIDLYNHFVRSHQPELIQSDARLKAYFVQRDGGRGEASYHTYKTELANSSSLRSIQSTDEFCDRADADFGAADSYGALSEAVGDHRWAIEATYQVCHGGRVETASTETAPSASERHPSIPSPGAPPATESRDADRSQVKAPSPHRRLEGDAL